MKFDVASVTTLKIATLRTLLLISSLSTVGVSVGVGFRDKDK